jgi:hypothetical protein
MAAAAQVINAIPPVDNIDPTIPEEFAASIHRKGRYNPIVDNRQAFQSWP